MPIPARLYKYEPWSTRALQNLKSQIIHFGSPLNFNDPYDCAITPHITEPDDVEVERIRKHYLLDSRSNVVATKARLSSMAMNELRAMLVKAAKDALKNNIDDFLKNKGVACFSEANDSLLMWSHYGGRYRGFCLEFSTADAAFAKVKKVRYSPALPTCRVSSMLVDKDFDPVLEIFTTKAEPWAYEREWRSIHSQAGTAFGYSVESLTGIYFGPDMDTQSVEIVCLVLKGQNERVKFWQGRRSDTEFRVEFEPFTYTSFLEAKRMGLR